MGFVGTSRISGRSVHAVVACLVLSTMLCAMGWATRAEAALYFGKKEGEWHARILVRDNMIKAVKVSVPSTCSGGSSRLTWETGWKGQPMNIRIRRFGGFYAESYTRWSKQVFRGRLVGNRLQGNLWFADRGDYVQCWTGRGPKPEWVGFTARRWSVR
ncbi:MAG: hypothetical protein QG596_1013 [Actinomycetota bacterium]|nr:hypothetical protein [Actinomycetota bacterium]